MGSNISQASLPWNPDSQERPEKPIIAFFFFVLGGASFQISCPSGAESLRTSMRTVLPGIRDSLIIYFIIYECWTLGRRRRNFESAKAHSFRPPIGKRASFAELTAPESPTGP